MPVDRTRTAVLRIVIAITLAMAFSFGVYALLEATHPTSGLISFSFLLILPAAISAFVAYVGDPFGKRDESFYLLIPLWLLGAAIVMALLFLREGAVCIILLTPLWLVSGMVGAFLTYRIRRRLKGGQLRAVAFMIVPLGALQIEQYFPPHSATATVVRSIVVNAPPSEIWPLLEGVPDVQPSEGRWNISQDVIGIPRPVGAHLIGEGLGAQRIAKWTDQIQFREVITEWRPGRRIGWRFVFDDLDSWAFTDRHLKPDSAYFKVTSGGYTLTPLDLRRTRVTLDTSYWIKTPVNGYSMAWGEVFLGDLENNLLAVIQQRAEEPKHERRL
jgi:hypothetical protein